MEWTEEAIKELENVPSRIRNMARMGIEDLAEKKGKKTIDIEDVKEARERYLDIIKPGKAKEKIAIVRCDIVSETCPGVGCLKAYDQKKVHFSGYEDVQLIGFFTCGGCPGRRVHRLVESLLKHGLTTVHLSSCMLLDRSYPKCPHIDAIKETIEKKGIKIVNGTHH